MDKFGRAMGNVSIAIAVACVAATTTRGAGVAEERPSEWTEAVQPGFAGDYREHHVTSPWHGRRLAIGGLGFQVVLGAWPRLLQRGELDVFNRQHNREIYEYVAFQDLGELRAVGPTGGAGTPTRPRLRAASWCYRTYVFGQGGSALELTVSRLTPAVVVKLRGEAIDLFAGSKRGNRRPNDATSAVPAHVAFVDGHGQVVVRSTEQPVELRGMNESWMLFWFGRATYLRRTRIPNVLARLDIPGMIRSGRYLEPSDLPVLCVFQHRPQAMRSTGDALRVTFHGEAGAIVLLPLFGSIHLPVDRTSAWQKSFPTELLERCRTWAKRLKRFPLAVAEAYRALPSGDVAVSQRFLFVELNDDWRTVGEPFAPVPPVVALCYRQGFPVEIGTPGRDRKLGRLFLSGPQVIATDSGPYSGVPGADAVMYTVRGVSRYVDGTAAWPPPHSHAARQVADELEWEVKKLLDAGPLAPARNLIGWLEPHFKNPGETVRAVADALPYLTPAQREAAQLWLLRFVDRYDPLASDGLSAAGAGRGYAKPDSVEPIRTVERPVRWEDRANNVYALWLLAYVTGNWRPVDERAEAIRQIADVALDRLDWATCSYFRGPGEDRSSARAHRGEDRGSTWAVNGQFARWVALARIARHWRDARLEARARYLLARTMLVRFAQAALFPYAYDHDLMRVELEPDWMLRLSTGTGNGAGPGLLWLPRWKEAADDVRAVIRWDEFGPVVAQTLNHFWQPVLPHFQDLTPECGRFLADHLRDRCLRVLHAIELNAPAWHLVRRSAYLGKEMHVDSPRNSCSVFLARCYIAGATGRDMLHYQDIPFVRVGDLYHMQRLVANLRAFGESDGMSDDRK